MNCFLFWRAPFLSLHYFLFSSVQGALHAFVRYMDVENSKVKLLIITNTNGDGGSTALYTA